MAKALYLLYSASNPSLDVQRGKLMNRDDILRTALYCVTQDRAATHGKMEDNFQLIADYWSLHLGHDITANDVGVMMTLLKLARIKNGQVSNADNYVDAAGYMACSGEIAGKQSDE